MGETNTGRHLTPEAAAVEKARQYAEQRRAAARARFEAPSWVGPDRHAGGSPTIPTQAAPLHEELLDLVEESPGPSIPLTGHWVESAKPRVVAGVLLAVCVAGAATSLVLTVTTQSVGAVVGLVMSAFFAVLCRGAMMSAGLATVDLKGSILTVRHQGYVDRFDLAGPIQLVELVSVPQRRDWRLRLESPDGRLVELGGHQVDPVEMHRIVEYYRAIATRERRERERRNNL
ncbi:MAG TPA: hypothetical protein VFK34_13210 [Marmoricola sp.]|jgi:hypothetical protein|nr:hypothetical protein [Marmoricola sp.]